MGELRASVFLLFGWGLVGQWWLRSLGQRGCGGSPVEALELCCAEFPTLVHGVVLSVEGNLTWKLGTQGPSQQRLEALKGSSEHDTGTQQT